MTRDVCRRIQDRRDHINMLIEELIEVSLGLNRSLNADSALLVVETQLRQSITDISRVGGRAT